MSKVLKWLPPIREPYTLFLMIKDPRTPWQTKLKSFAIIVLILAYTFSPLDIIPDYIPILGWMDDLVLVPLGINLIERFLPQIILTENRAIARKRVNKAILIFGLGLLALFSVWALVITATVVSITRLG